MRIRIRRTWPTTPGAFTARTATFFRDGRVVALAPRYADGTQAERRLAEQKLRELVQDER
jgi:hypothetical protein